ncbi:MAG: hypothetical protein JSW10_00005, partial [Pseudomonadota bacterium]
MCNKPHNKAYHLCVVLLLPLGLLACSTLPPASDENPNTAADSNSVVQRQTAPVAETHEIVVGNAAERADTGPANPAYDAPYAPYDSPETAQPANSVPEARVATDDALATPDDEAPQAPVAADIWDRIRDGFLFQAVDHPRIDKELAWFARHPQYMDRVADRAAPYMH